MLKRFLLIVIPLFLVFGCDKPQPPYKLTGRIAVYDRQSKEYSIYMNSKIQAITFKESEHFSGINWLNNNEEFLSNKVIPGVTRKENRYDIVRRDLSGEVLETIYKAQKGEVAWPLHSSHGDKYLLFTTHHLVNPEIYPFEGLAPMLKLVVMNLEQKKVVFEIDSIGRSPNFKVEESPWLFSGDKFIYSIDNGVQLRLKGDELINPITTPAGIYIFDLNTGIKSLLVPDARIAIASPKNDQIAYQKENSIRVLDLVTNEERIIYKHSSKEQILGMHWTPDGKHVYFACRYRWGLGRLFVSSDEKLIEAESGEEVNFEKISFGFFSYSWR